MSLRRHFVPEEAFFDIARGGGEASATGLLLAAQRSKRLLLMRGVRDLAGRSAEHPDGGPVREAYDLLARIERADPAAAGAVLRYPTIGPWATACLTGQARRDARDGALGSGWLAAVAAAAAIRAGIAATVEVPVHAGWAVLPSLGRASLPPEAARAVVRTIPAEVAARTTEATEATARATEATEATAGATETTEEATVGAAIRTAAGVAAGAAARTADGAAARMAAGMADGDTAGATATAAEIVSGARRVTVLGDPHRDGDGWQAVRRLAASHDGVDVTFLLDDHDPHRMPGAARAAGRLAAAEVDHWRAVLRDAWELLVRRHRARAEDVRSLITVLTPLVAPPNGQASATSKQAIGNVGASRPPDPYSLAVTLAHESQHVKLTALLDVVRLTRPDDGSRHYAPWRDDPRPVDGLLQGAFAHQAVAGFWRRERDDATGELALRAHTEFAHWRDATDLTIRVLLAGGRLTEAGEAFVGEMARTVRAWCREPVPEAALRRARTAAVRHRDAWRRRNGDLPAAVPGA